MDSGVRGVVEDSWNARGMKCGEMGMTGTNVPRYPNRDTCLRYLSGLGIGISRRTVNEATDLSFLSTPNAGL